MRRMTVAFPPKGRVGLDLLTCKASQTTCKLEKAGEKTYGKDGRAVREDREAVVLVLSVEHSPAWQRDHSSFDVLLLQGLGGVQGDVDLGTGGDDGDVGVLDFLNDVSSLSSLGDG